MKDRALSTLLALALCAAAFCACGKADAPTWQDQYDLGVRYLSEGNYEEAVIAFTAAIEIDPKQAPAYVGRGDAYVLSGETGENLTAAQADYEKAIELDDTLAEAYLGLADVYIRQGDYDRAMEILRQGSEKIGGNQDIADKLAEMEAGSYTDALGNVRRRDRYNADGTMEGYTIYDYDSLSRRIGWTIYQKNEGTEDYTIVTTCAVDLDEYGRPAQNNFFDSDGMPTNHDTFVYNDKNQKTEQRRYTADGTLDSYFLFYYDDAGRQTKYEGYNSDGNMYAYWISEYDASGTRIRETHYSADGSVVGYSTFG